VIAPHPDDEALIGSGVLLHALQSDADAAVIVMTNGDLDCIHDGIKRESESVKGLAALGLPEESIFFLGYPDGGLSLLGITTLPPRKRIINGACVGGNTTYGAHGFGGHDYHTARFGSPASYTRENAVADLESLLAELRPTDVVITHPEDTHPDHAMTYALFRTALDRLPEAPRVHRALVHNGDCWPTGTGAHEPCPAATIAPDQPTPPLSGRLTGYTPTELLPVPASCLVPDPASNPKLRAIGAHASQTRESLQSYLFAFAHSDEAFFPETFGRTGVGWRRVSDGPPTDTVTTVLRVGHDERRPVALRAPFAVSAHLTRPEQRAGGRVARLRVLEDQSGSYELSIDADRRTATLVRRVEGAASELLREWPLPHDLWEASPVEHVRFTIQPRPDDGDVAELILRLRHEMVGVAVDVHPRLRGDQISISNLATDDGEITVRGVPEVSASPSARP
jgi:LmbE family N-acetylglucosaminyl deacetylase